MEKMIKEINKNNFFNEEISPMLLDAIKDIVDDPEYQYDKNLSGDGLLDIVLNDKNLLKGILTQLKSDYEHDIELEKGANEDYTYLIPTYDEICKFLIILNIK